MPQVLSLLRRTVRGALSRPRRLAGVVHQHVDCAVTLRRGTRMHQRWHMVQESSHFLPSVPHRAHPYSVGHLYQHVQEGQENRSRTDLEQLGAEVVDSLIVHEVGRLDLHRAGAQRPALLGFLQRGAAS